MREFKKNDIVAFDYETTGFINEPNAKIFAYAFCWADDGHIEVYRDDFSRLKEFLLSPCAGIAHNFKFEWAFTNRHGFKINPSKTFHDTMICSQYTDNLCPSHALDYIAARYTGPTPEWKYADKQVHKAGIIYGTYDKIPKYLMEPYQRNDVERTALLFDALYPYVSPKSEYINEIELVKRTAEIEKTGMMLCKEKSVMLLDWMGKELVKANETAVKLIRHPINLNSEKQVSDLLYNILKLPRQESIDKHAINKLIEISNHPILDCIQRVRTYTKGIAMVRSYIEYAKIDGAVHPSFKTNHDKTGREASENPNGQNVSKEKRANVKYTVPARQCFRSRPGYFLLTADYKGIEMYLGVQGTGSKRLIKLCEQEFDFHDAFATSMYGSRYINEKDTKAKKALRSLAKNARFAKFYGAGIETIAETLGLSVDEVAAGYERDEKEYPEFKELMDDCTSQARKYGGIKTFFGRFLRVHRDKPYAATDYLIQGSAASLFKHGQIAVFDYFLSQYPERARILLKVHDELVMELHRSLLYKLPIICRDVESLMTKRKEITVPLRVEFGLSFYTWDMVQEYNI